LEQPLRLLVVDPDLASAIEGPARRRGALQAVKTGRLELFPGDRFEPSQVAERARFGIVVLSGFMVRELTTDPGRVSADLLGPEDVVQCDRAVPEIAMLQHTVSWTALSDVRLALLDEAFFARTAEWPELAGALFERAGRSWQRLALRGAISTLQSVDARVLASLWTWAAQWGTVAGQGVVLRAPLSHERLARLVHARRPTVTSAIGRLRSEGLVGQRKDGAWLLHAPRLPDEAAQSSNGVAMPVLAEMGDRTLGVRRTATGVMTQLDSSVVAARELRGRLAEQRETLRVAVHRHHEMLERMREEAEKLAAGGGRRK
jgi:CRP/FNR family cyclic AMP-dependent transcriptional regulator